MPILPPGLALTLLLDGRPLPAYTPVYLVNGHVMGPVDPCLTHVAQRMQYEGGFVVFTRGGRSVRLRMARREPEQLAQTYVELGPLLRALGEAVELDRAHRTVDVRSSGAIAVRSSAPFDPHAPQAPLSVVFTPSPPPPAAPPPWTGTPQPRRTPIPIKAWATPLPEPSAGRAG